VRLTLVCLCVRSREYRQGPVGQESVKISRPQPLEWNQAKNLYDVLDSSNAATVFSLPAFWPNYFRIPLTGAVKIDKAQILPFSMVLNRTISDRVVNNSTGGQTDTTIFVEYWSILTNNTIDADWATTLYTPNIVTVSSQMPTGITASLASSGIIGLCTLPLPRMKFTHSLTHSLLRCRHWYRAGDRALLAHCAVRPADDRHLPGHARDHRYPHHVRGHLPRAAGWRPCTRATAVQRTHRIVPLA